MLRLSADRIYKSNCLLFLSSEALWVETAITASRINSSSTVVNEEEIFRTRIWKRILKRSDRKPHENSPLLLRSAVATKLKRPGFVETQAFSIVISKKPLPRDLPISFSGSVFRLFCSRARLDSSAEAVPVGLVLACESLPGSAFGLSASRVEPSTCGSVGTAIGWMFHFAASHSSAALMRMFGLLSSSPFAYLEIHPTHDCATGSNL